MATDHLILRQNVLRTVTVPEQEDNLKYLEGLAQSQAAAAGASAGAAAAAQSAAQAAQAAAAANQTASAQSKSDSAASATQAVTARQAAEAARDTASTQAGIAATQASLATTNGAAQVALAAAQVGIATTQAGLATTNGAAQVALAAAQVGVAAARATDSANSATASAGSATAAAGSATGSAASAATATTQAGIATTQAGLATTNGAAQVALATTQAGNATAQAGAAATSATAAQAAQTAAQAARDAALIQAGVYVDEPTGRAAVADGAAFKVQGIGDVAAYEYRRINSGSSSLIATYPSQAAVAALNANGKPIYKYTGAGPLIPKVIYLDGRIAEWFDAGQNKSASEVSASDPYVGAAALTAVRGTELGKSSRYVGSASVVPIVVSLDGKVLLGLNTATAHPTLVCEISSTDPYVQAAALAAVRGTDLGKTMRYVGAGPVVPLAISLDGKVLSGWDTSKDQAVASASMVSESSPKPLATADKPAVTDWRMVEWDGESTTVGAFSSALISASQPYANLSWSAGPSSSKAGSVGSNPGLAAAAPLAEANARAESGSGSPFETPTSATCNFVVERSIIENGIAPSAMVLFGSAGGHSGYRLDQIQWGSAWAQLKLDQFSAFVSLAAAAGKTNSVAALVLDCSVNDSSQSTNAAAYEAALRAYVQGAQTQIKAITGQTTPIHVFIVQGCCYATQTAGSGILKAIQKVCATEPYAHMLPPVYHVPFYSDLIHLTEVGYDWKGKLAGKHIKQLLDGYVPQPLNPISATYRNGVLAAKFSIRFKPLVIDATAIATVTNYGIRAKDDAGDITLNNPQVINGDTLQWVASRAPGANAVLRFGLDYNITGGPYLGAATNIRDSYPESAVINGTSRPLWDVCPAAELSILTLGG